MFVCVGRPYKGDVHKYVVHSTLYIIRCTMHCVHSALYNIIRTVYGVRRSQYGIHEVNDIPDIIYNTYTYTSIQFIGKINNKNIKILFRYDGIHQYYLTIDGHSWFLLVRPWVLSTTRTLVRRRVIIASS